MVQVSTKPWGQFTEASWDDSGDYCASCLIDLSPTGKPSKQTCHLPVYEPDPSDKPGDKGGATHGPLNVNALQAAATVLAGARGGVQAPPAAKKAAARKLLRLYGEAQMDPPASLRQMVK